VLSAAFLDGPLLNLLPFLGARKLSMEKQRSPNAATKLRLSHLPPNVRDRNVVKMAQAILAHFSNISNETAFAR